MTFKVSLGMIVRNEGRTLRQCLESVVPHVDEVVIALAGESTDDTEEILHNFEFPVGSKVFIVPWTDDFSEARNQVLDKVTGDYFMWLDGDDQLIGGEHIRKLIATYPNTDIFYMGYDYARDENGSCTCYLVRERIVRLHDQLPDRGWKWIGKVHEVLDPRGFVPETIQVSDMLVKHHKPINKHAPDRNLKILYRQLEEQEPNPDPRLLGYLCTEQAARGNFQEAILHANRFVQLSGWREERYQMQHRLADIYRIQKDYRRALNADMLAMQICPEWPDAWFGLAESYLHLENYLATVEMTKAGATKEPPNTFLIVNPYDYSYSPYVVLAAAYAHLGDFESALGNYSQAYDAKPSVALASQIEILKREVKLQDIVQSVLKLREQLGRNDEWMKVRKLFDVIPKHIEHHPLIMDAWERSMVQTAHIEKPEVMVDFYAGNPQWEPIPDETMWDPAWLDYPRLEFAMNTARRLNASTLVDWGCSDGFISLPIAKELGLKVTGFDLDPRCVHLAALRAEEKGLEARFEVGNIEEVGSWEGQKADLGLLFEVIEHVVDPARTLEKLEKTAEHVAITMPYLAWEDGNIPAWDRSEPKGHLRIYDQFDLEGLLAPRGRIWNLYRQPWGNQGHGWLFADYHPGAKTGKTIIIGAFGGPESWNPRTFETGGLGGSETAVLKLAEALARQNHKVIVYTNVDEPGYYNGVCYRPEEHYRPEIESDIYIAWRNPIPADWAVNSKKVVLWMHDTDSGETLTPERARRFDSIHVLSEWHAVYMIKRYPFLTMSDLTIIGNGIDVERFVFGEEKNPKQVIYSSSPDRGLDIVLESIWPKVIEKVPDAELHIYYGWNIVDRFLDVAPHLRDFKYKMLNLLANATGVVQHGRVDQQTLAQAFLKSSVWLYPTYFTETYCITAVEAQLAGAIPVTNHLAALTETVRSGIVLSEDVWNPLVQQEYADAVIKVLMTPLEERQEMHQKVRDNAPVQTWDEVASLWLQAIGDIRNG